MSPYAFTQFIVFTSNFIKVVLDQKLEKFEFLLVLFQVLKTVAILFSQVAAPHKPAANQDKENWPNRTVLASQEDWGSDDDESVFLDIDTTVIDQPPVHQVKVVEVVKTVPEPEPEICVRKFPGPAGLISKVVGSKLGIIPLKKFTNILKT